MSDDEHWTRTLVDHVQAHPYAWSALAGLAVIAAAGAWLTQPVAHDEARAAPPENGELEQRLVEGGIERVLVDVTDERTLVRYRQPANLSTNASMGFAMAEAANVAPDVPEIVVQVYEGDHLKVEASVATEDVLAYQNGNVATDEFRERVDATWHT